VYQNNTAGEWVEIHVITSNLTPVLSMSGDGSVLYFLRGGVTSGLFSLNLSTLGETRVGEILPYTTAMMVSHLGNTVVRHLNMGIGYAPEVCIERIDAGVSIDTVTVEGDSCTVSNSGDTCVVSYPCRAGVPGDSRVIECVSNTWKVGSATLGSMLTGRTSNDHGLAAISGDGKVIFAVMVIVRSRGRQKVSDVETLVQYRRSPTGWQYVGSVTGGGACGKEPVLNPISAIVCCNRGAHLVMYGLMETSLPAGRLFKQDGNGSWSKHELPVSTESVLSQSRETPCKPGLYVTAKEATLEIRHTCEGGMSSVLLMLDSL